jgi:hypothetical protein
MRDMNLDNLPGRGLFSTLFSVYTLKLPASIWDHRGDNCNYLVYMIIW